MPTDPEERKEPAHAGKAREEYDFGPGRVLSSFGLAALATAAILLILHFVLGIEVF